MPLTLFSIPHRLSDCLDKHRDVDSYGLNLTPELNVSTDISMTPCLKSGCNLPRTALPNHPEFNYLIASWLSTVVGSNNRQNCYCFNPRSRTEGELERVFGIISIIWVCSDRPTCLLR